MGVSPRAHEDFGVDFAWLLVAIGHGATTEKMRHRKPGHPLCGVGAWPEQQTL